MNCQATKTTHTRLTAPGFNQQVFLVKHLILSYSILSKLNNDPRMNNWPKRMTPQALCEQASNGSITDCNACQVTLHDRTNSENWNSSASMVPWSWFGRGTMASSCRPSTSSFEGFSPKQVSDPRIQNIRSGRMPQLVAFLPDGVR